MDYIIQSLLDTDFYKFTMGQVVFKEFRDVHVRYALRFRTKGVNLVDHIDIDELRYQLDLVRHFRFNNSDLHYLRGTNEYGERMFSEDYLDFLRNLELPDYTLSDSLDLEFRGPWSTTIYWETYALSIISELYYRGLLSKMSDFERDVIFAQGKVRLDDKIKKLRTRPGLTFSDFGTRRRFSRAWQEYIVKTLAEELPISQFLGTSNVQIAMDYGLVPMGTSAHEMYMGISGIMHGSDDEIRRSHNEVLKLWYKHYGKGLSIALTDTYGSDFFFRDMNREQAELWRGLRQDSGNPYIFGEKAIRFYNGYDIDPATKLIVFSDGLDVVTMINLYDTFTGRIQVTDGWGTNLTNDLGLPPISMVVKLIESNGHGTVKFSDNLAKAIGKPEDIERFKKIFGYDSTYSASCTY
jgi:nicotinate phosphoribosyltransferase